MEEMESLKINFYIFTGTIFATSYNRVVIGGQGPYIEFNTEHIVAELITKPGEEYRGTGKYISCKFFWLQPITDPTVKVYLQRRTVTYADYKPGLCYVSPMELVWDNSPLIAEMSNNPVESGKGILTKYKMWIKNDAINEIS